MPTPPESTKISLGQRLRERARQRWPALATVNLRHRGGFAYVTGELADGTAKAASGTTGTRRRRSRSANGDTKPAAS